jgi:hypothetical protein
MFNTVFGLSNEGLITSFGGGKLKPAGFVVNCPIISQLN